MKKIYNNQINAKVNLLICLTSNQEITFGSSGTIELRKGSKSGELIESFDVSSDKVIISARELLIQPSQQLPFETEIYMVVSDGFVVSSVNGSSFSGFDLNGNKEFKFITEDPIGKSLDGGVIISKNNGTYTIVSPKKSEMNLTWYEFSKAIQKAEEETGTTGWYVPSLYELQNHKEVLKLQDFYWTSTENDLGTAYKLNMNSNVPYVASKIESYLVRTFKKVNY
jgi:hypothetical protein